MHVPRAGRTRRLGDHPQQLGDPAASSSSGSRPTPFADAVGHPLDLQQANCSVSAAGVLRGIHFADVPPGQAKYVTCARGAVLDVVVDIRVGSPTFGPWDSVLLDDVDRRAIYLAEGLGHAFLSLEDDSTVVYLCSHRVLARARARHPPAGPRRSAIDWPTHGRDGRPLIPSCPRRTAPRRRWARRRPPVSCPSWSRSARTWPR